jgi:hypothetical protein
MAVEADSVFVDDRAYVGNKVSVVNRGRVRRPAKPGKDKQTEEDTHDRQRCGNELGSAPTVRKHC